MQRPPPKASRGFTLIEVLVVLLIIGLTVGFVTLSIGTGGAARQTEEEARRLAALIELAREEAVLRSQELAIEFRRDGYRFLQLSEEKWLPLGDDELLRRRVLPSGIELALELEDDEVVLSAEPEKETPHVFLLSSGESSPFVVTLATSDQSVLWRVAGREDTAVTLTRMVGDG